MPETWKALPGYEDTYEVSDYGHVRSIERFVRGRDGSARKLQGQLIQPRKREDGALAVNLWAANKFKQRLVHHLVLETFDRPKPRGCEAVHLNNNVQDNRRENLRWELIATARKRRAIRAKLERRR